MLHSMHVQSEGALRGIVTRAEQMRRLEVGLLAYWCRALPLLALVDGGEAKHALQEAANPGEGRKGLEVRRALFNIMALS